MGKGNFEWEERGVPLSSIGLYGHCAVPCAKTAEPIKMPFGLWARVGRRNRVLEGGSAMLRNVAMTTNFGTQFAITGFVGYNFGCMIHSDKQFDSMGGFSGSRSPMKT